MADYFSPTVVRPTIANSDMTPLEQLLLSHIFTAEPEGDGQYFYAERSIDDLPVIPVGDLLATLSTSEGIESRAAALVRDKLAALQADAASIQLDVTDTSWAFLIQDIVRRSPGLAYVSVLSAFVCTKMDPDGFGGMAMVITADNIKAKTTDARVDEMLATPEYGPIGAEPGHGVHILLRLCKDHVRTQSWTCSNPIRTRQRSPPTT